MKKYRVIIEKSKTYIQDIKSYTDAYLFPEKLTDIDAALMKVFGCEESELDGLVDNLLSLPLKEQKKAFLKHGYLFNSIYNAGDCYYCDYKIKSPKYENIETFVLVPVNQFKEFLSRMGIDRELDLLEQFDKYLQEEFDFTNQYYNENYNIRLLEKCACCEAWELKASIIGIVGEEYVESEEFRELLRNDYFNIEDNASLEVIYPF